MKKKMNKLMALAAFALAAMFGLTASAGPAPAILIASDGKVTYDGESATAYSSGNYYAIDKSGDFGGTVESIRTEAGVANAGTSITFTGVRGIDNGASTLKITSMPGGIAITNNGWIGAINQQSSSATTGSSDLDVQGVGDIFVKSTASNKGAKGIGAYSAKNPDITQNKINVSAKSLTVEAEGGTAYGIQGTLAGRTTTVNIENAMTVKGVGVAGKAYLSNLTQASPLGKATLNFGSVSAISEESLAYGFHSAGDVDADITLNGDMTVVGSTYGIGFRVSGATEFDLEGKDGKEINITVSSTSNYSQGADVGNGSTSTAKLNLDVNNFTVASANAEAYGLYAEASPGAAIVADVKNLSASAGTDAYAIYTEGGAITILNSATITANGATSSKAVYAAAGSTVTFSNSVTLVGDVANAGTLAIGAYSGKPSIALTGAFNNTGTLAVDMTGADTSAEYTLVDDTDGGENTYGTVSITSGWASKVVDGDLIAYVPPPAAKIGTVEYTTIQAAFDAVQDNETITILAGTNNEVVVNNNSTRTGVTIVGETDADGNNLVTWIGYLDLCKGKSGAECNNFTVKNIDFKLMSSDAECGGIWLGQNSASAYFLIDHCCFDSQGWFQNMIYHSSSYGNGMHGVLVRNCTVIGGTKSQRFTNGTGDYAFAAKYENCTLINSANSLQGASTGKYIFENCNITNDFAAGASNPMIWMGSGASGQQVIITNCVVTLLNLEAGSYCGSFVSQLKSGSGWDGSVTVSDVTIHSDGITPVLDSYYNKGTLAMDRVAFYDLAGNLITNQYDVARRMRLQAGTFNFDMTYATECTGVDAKTGMPQYNYADAIGVTSADGVTTFTFADGTTAVQVADEASCSGALDDTTAMLFVDGGEFSGTVVGTEIYIDANGTFSGTATVEPTGEFFNGGTVTEDAVFNVKSVMTTEAKAQWRTDNNIPEGATVNTYVAAIGETKYYTLNGALTAATAGQTVDLLADVTETSFTLKDGITLDTHGKNLNTASGWTLQNGSVLAANTITNGADLTAMSSVGTVNGSVYASSGTLDLRGVDLRVKGEPAIFGGTAENPTTLGTLKATRVFFGDIYDGGGNQTVTNIVLENCTTAYRAALGVYYDTLTVDTVSVNAAEGWYWDQQYQNYNYQMYTGFGGTLVIKKSLTTGEYMNAGYSTGGTGVTILESGAAINCVDFQNTGNSASGITAEQAAANIANGVVHVNGAEATLNAAALNNHAITTFGTVNLTSHPVLTTADNGLFNVNYGTGAVLTIGQLNFLNKTGDATKSQMRAGDNAVTTIGGLSTNPEVGTDFYVTQTSDTTVNKDGGNAVQFTGDIVFTTYADASSAGAKFTLNLDSGDDAFTGAIRGTTSAGKRWGKWASAVNGDEVAGTDNITGMTLTVTNGAVWNMTGDSAVNALTVKGATLSGGTSALKIPAGGTFALDYTAAISLGSVDNNGAIRVDMTGATEDEYTLITATGDSDYGTNLKAIGAPYTITKSGNNLVATRFAAVAAIVNGSAMDYYESFASALAAAADSGDTIKMLASDTLTGKVDTGKSFTLDLNGQAIDGDNKYGFVLGGSVTIRDSSGDDSGKITHCTKAMPTDPNEGGAIKFSNGTLTLESGTLCENAGTGQGGAIFVNSGTFNMTGGRIVSNTSVLHGAGVSVAGTATFNFTGGVISNNVSTTRYGCNVYNNGTFVMGDLEGTTNPQILDTTGLKGAGISTAGTFTFNSGVIAGCVTTQSTGYGSAIFMDGGTVTMNGGVISNCVAQGAYGCGAVCVQGTFRMHGGRITQCASWANKNYPDYDGGGAFFVYRGNKLEIDGGEIAADNTVLSGHHGAGIYVQSGNSSTKVAISGNAVINAEVYFNDASDLSSASAITGGKFGAPVTAREFGASPRTVLQGGIYTEDAKTNSATALIPLTQAFVANTDEATKAAYPWMISDDLVTIAMIGNTKYLTLGLAMADAQPGDTVKLLNATDESVEMTTGVKFDKNGKDYTGTLTAPDGSFIRDNGDGTYDSLVLIAEVITATATNSYETVDKALAAVGDGEKVLLMKANYTNEPTVTVSRAVSFALDLNGYTMTSDLTISGGALTLTNGTLVAQSADGAAVTLAGGVLNVAESAQVKGAKAIQTNGGLLTVSGGTVQGVATNAVLFGKGALAYVAGGTFLAPDGLCALAHDAASTAAGAYPTNFVYAALDAEEQETGYPLFGTTIPNSYIGFGYTLKDNLNGTWTVTAGNVEIKTVVEGTVVANVTNTVPDMTSEEAQTATNQVEEIQGDVVNALKETNDADLTGTGINEATKNTDGTVQDYVLDALTNAAPDAVKGEITTNSTIESYIEIKLQSLDVTVATNVSETTSRVIESTLTSITYDVKPIVTTKVITGDTVVTVTTNLEGQTLTSPVTFKLDLQKTFPSDIAKVTHTHNGEEIVERCVVETGADGSKWIMLTWTQFCMTVAEAEEITGYACWANGNIYESVTNALEDTSLPDDATIVLLKDCGETDLPLGYNQVIDRHGHAFTGTLDLAEPTETEMVRGAAGTIYVASNAVDVSTSPTTTLPIRGFAFPSGMEDPDDRKAYLEETLETTGNPRWMSHILGTDLKLLPQIVPAASEGISKVVIRAQDDFVVATPEKSGTVVSFNLLKKEVGGAYQPVTNAALPYFQVDVKDLSEKTYWKIQTMFESAEE